MAAMGDTDAVTSAITRTHASEWSRIVATLIRITGDWSLAEDAAADAFEKALERWPIDGIPRTPAAWITTTARNAALDRLRRSGTETRKLQEVGMMRELDALPGEIEDDRLRLIFTCCHPALTPESRVALTLRTVAGLTTDEIARAFIVPEATMAQRIVRAKRKIANAGIPYRVPPPELLERRLDGVLSVLYLVFTAGYTRTDDPAHDEELAGEAIRLCETLSVLMPREGRVFGLLSLLLLQHARRRARTDADGELVQLDDQDRTLWDHALIRRGLAALDTAVRLGAYGRYQLLASIAAVHAAAATPETTDYLRLADLYDVLRRTDPNPVVHLNAAIAHGMAFGPGAGLAAVDQVAASGELDGYYLLPAARADFLRRLGRADEAAEHYDAAIALTPPGPERRYLERRVRELGLAVRED